jgi:hypothetical protein
LLGSLLLSIHFGCTIFAHKAFDASSIFQFFLTTPSFASALERSASDSLFNSPIGTLTAQTSNDPSERKFDRTENLHIFQQRLRELQENREFAIILISLMFFLVLLCSLAFSPKFFGSFIKVAAVIVFLSLLTYSIVIFIQNFPPTKDLFPSDSSSTSVTSPLLSYLNNLWRVFGLVILFGVLALVLHWLSSKGGIVVLPFEVISKELSNNQENYYGKAIADLLIEELYRIQQIHALPQELEKESTDNINIRLGNRNFPPLSAMHNQLGDVLT